MPKVSVIMPIYNEEEYLSSAIDSVLNQSFLDFELILVDDGSYDSSPLICDKYAARDSRILVIHKENGGLSSARNAGLDMATGKYVYMIDSDDTIEPLTLELTFSKAEVTGADLTIVGVTVHNIESDGKETLIPKRRTEILIRGKEIGDNLCTLIRDSMYNYAWDKLYLRECIEKHKSRYDSNYDRVCEDTVFLYDILPDITCITTVPQCCYNYMIRKNHSVVKKYIPERFEKYMSRLTRLCKIADTYTDSKVEFSLLIKEQYAFSLQWAIANMFHEDCRLGLIEKWKYYRWMRELDTIDPAVRKGIKICYGIDVSRGEIILIKMYQLGMLWIMSLTTQILIYIRKLKQL